MRAMNLASGKPTACLDWNNNYGDDENKVILFHCGPVAQTLMAGKGTVTEHKMFAKGDPGSGWGTNEGRIAPFAMTFSNGFTEDGKLKVYVSEAKFTDDKIEGAFFGCGGVAEIPDLQNKLIRLAKGGFKVDSQTIDLPIGRHPVDRKKMAVLTSPAAHAKEAVTHYEVLERFGEVTYLKANLKTGRTHQIRVHFSHIGHALVGDEVYGGAKIRLEKLHAALLDGQMLHAKKLSFIHPRTNEKVEFECPLPKNFETMLTILRKG